ncbi:MAG: hypothetical protein JW973_12265 [Bacteroidales bacterium]|nr:hypothetical protein [Bacteroidales bacterium]
MGLLILLNFGKVYYWISLIDFNIHQSDRNNVVDMIKINKLNDYSYKSSINWINLPDSLKNLSQGGNVRIEMIENKISVFFYLKFKESEDPIGFAYFDTPMTKERIMNINNPNSFYFGDKWIKKINDNWFYIESITIRETGP